MAYVFNGILAGVEENNLKVIPDDAKVYRHAAYEEQYIMTFPVKDFNSGKEILAVVKANHNNEDIRYKIAKFYINIWDLKFNVNIWDLNLLALFKVGKKYRFKLNYKDENRTNGEECVLVINDNLQITSIDILDGQV